MKRCSIFLLTFVAVLGLLRSETLFSDVDPQPGQSEWTVAYNIALEIDDAVSGSVTPSDASTPIEQADFSGGTYTISTAGTYHLSESVTGDISIESNNVYLNLNSYTCTGDIDVITSLERIKIRNGFVVSGNITLTTSDYIRVEDIVVDTGQINLNGTSGCRVSRCDIISTPTFGIELYSADYNLIEDCRVLAGTDDAGYFLSSCDYNVVRNCHAVDISGTDPAGFHALNGHGNLFTECVANNIGTASSTTAYGFLLDEDSTQIMCSMVDTVSASSDTNRGIFVTNDSNDCLLRGNTIFNCARAIEGESEDVFDDTYKNLAIQTIAYNSTAENYKNLPNVQDYDHTAAVDNTTLFDNVAIPDNTL